MADRGIVITTTRSRIAAWSICEQLWWWEARELLEPRLPRLDATTSRCTHYGLRLAVTTGQVDAAVSKATKRFRGLAAMAQAFRTATGALIYATPELVTEQECLIEAQVRGWMLFRFEAIDQKFHVLSVEEPYYAPLSANVRLRVKPDALLEHKAEPTVRVLDYKSIARESATWAGAIARDPQPLAYCVGIRSGLADGGSPFSVDGFQVEVLPRGERRDGRQASPLVYGYAAQAYPPYEVSLTSPEPFARGKGVRFLVRDGLKQRNPVGTWLVAHATKFRPMFSSYRLDPPSEAVAARWVKEVVDTEERLSKLDGGGVRRQGLNGGRCASRSGQCPFFGLCWEGRRDDYKPTEPLWEDEEPDDDAGVS
jgi:hypothetical protein